MNVCRNCGGMHCNPSYMVKKFKKGEVMYFCDDCGYKEIKGETKNEY